MNRFIVLDQILDKDGGFSKSLLLKRQKLSIGIRGKNQNEFIMCISRENDRKPSHISEPQRQSRVKK